jgi:hypothetical protein
MPACRAATGTPEAKRDAVHTVDREAEASVGRKQSESWCWQHRETAVCRDPHSAKQQAVSCRDRLEPLQQEKSECVSVGGQTCAGRVASKSGSTEGQYNWRGRARYAAHADPAFVCVIVPRFVHCKPGPGTRAIGIPRPAMP